MLTVLNQDRLEANEPPLGFVNPLLYQMWGDSPHTFNDITVGSNGGNHFIGGGVCAFFLFSLSFPFFFFLFLFLFLSFSLFLQFLHRLATTLPSTLLLDGMPFPVWELPTLAG